MASFFTRKKTEPIGPPFSQLGDPPAEPALAAFPSFESPGTPTSAADTSLRTTVKKRLLNDMIRNFAKEQKGVVICVDSLTLRIIGQVFKMSELLNDDEGVNVHLIENITMKSPSGDFLRRQPLPEMTALYFIQPTVESVNRLIADFRDKKKPMYNQCHLYFTSRLSDALFTKLKSSTAIARVAGFKELNLELVCIEPNAFVLDSPNSLPTLFAPDDAPSATELKLQEQHRLATMLTTLFATLGEMPHIRHASRPLATSFAHILHAKLTEMARPGGTFPSRIQTDAEKPTLLLLDRSSDMLSPVLHEFTYQAMVYDVLPVHDDRYRYTYIQKDNQKASKDVILNDDDKLWVKLRHLHIADLGSLLHAEYKQFLADNPEALKLQNAKEADTGIKGMTEGLRGLPKFQEASKRYSLHMALCQELMGKYNGMGLEEIAKLEQNMATGETAEGGKAYKTALADLRALLDRQDLAISPEDKIRLLMVYVISQDGIKMDERRQLMELAGIGPEDNAAILNLFHMNVTLLSGTSVTKKVAPKKGVQPTEAAYDVSRYSPPLKRHVEEIVSSGLSCTDFPFVVEPPALARPNSQSGSRGKGKAPADPEVPATGKKLIVFVIGGVSYSELRCMHEVARASGRDIIVGSTSMLTPQSLIIGLKAIKELDLSNV